MTGTPYLMRHPMVGTFKEVIKCGSDSLPQRDEQSDFAAALSEASRRDAGDPGVQCAAKRTEALPMCQFDWNLLFKLC